MSNISWECKNCGFYNVELTVKNELQKCFVCNESVLISKAFTITIEQKNNRDLERK